MNHGLSDAVVAIGLAIADQSMIDVVLNCGVPMDDTGTRFSLTNESMGEVDEIEHASPALQQACDWLTRRGLVSLKEESEGVWFVEIHAAEVDQARHPGPSADSGPHQFAPGRHSAA